jgi:hypothetical protein
MAIVNVNIDLELLKEVGLDILAATLAPPRGQSKRRVLDINSDRDRSKKPKGGHLSGKGMLAIAA